MSDTDQQNRGRLPAAVYDLAMRLGVKPPSRGSSVRLTQTGRMLRSLGSLSWMKFSAQQTISVRDCAFDWQARFGPFGLIAVRDALENDQGCLDVRALGFIPIMRAQRTNALTRGELMRYLAEIALAPDAILGNKALRWRVDAPDKLAVSAGSGETVAEVLFTLDRDGRIAGTFAPDRPRSVTAPFLPTPWRGQLSDYRDHDGLWLPFAAEIAWEIDGESETYWQGQMTHWTKIGDNP
jgi:hypothetical protein